MKVKLLSHTNNPEKVIAMSGKLCYAGCNIDELEENLTPEEIERFINMLIRINHQSPLEHATFTFAVEGISRVAEQQLTRHRIASYSIQSGRYVSRDNAEFTVPEDIKEYDYLNEEYNDFCNAAKNTYKYISDSLLTQYCYEYLVDTIKEYDERIQQDESFIHAVMREDHKKEYNAFKKKAIENARMVFPNSLQTKIIFTMNLRSLINFFEHRCCFRAQEEIRELANEMLKICKKEFPLLFNKLGASCKKGYCPEGAMQCSQLKGVIPTLADLQKSHLILKQKENKIQ